jgi:uncharacterized membrane protein YfcA
MWPDFLPSLPTLAIALPAVVVAYVIFGIAGFGAALICAPVLAHALPVATIVPLLALLDCGAATINGVRMSEQVAKNELLWVLPLMAIGSVAGIYLLLALPERPMMLALGIFVMGYALYGLFAPPPSSVIRRGWVALFAPLGGIFSGMFGSGGAIYAIYLSRRVTDRDAFRATQTTLVGLATLTRGAVFALAGLYSDWHMLAFALLLAPAMLIGIWIGHHMTFKLSRDVFFRVLYLVLIGSGLSLAVRALSGL